MKRKSLKPYSKDGQEKYSESDFTYGNRSHKRARQDAKDANRAIKKQKRQELKRELEDEILKLSESTSV